MTDYIETVAEEITMFTGLKANVDGGIIRIDTIAGDISFKPAFYHLMEDVYRFIYIYGIKLQSYGLIKRKEEQHKRESHE